MEAQKTKRSHALTLPRGLLFRSYGWLITGVVMLALGHLLVWERGFYSDDYGTWDRIQRQGGPVLEWKPRMFGILCNDLLTALMPEHEFWARLLSAIGVGLNALLAGWLVFRLTRSRIAATVAGWLFLVPHHAQLALQYLGASAYILSMGSALLLLHSSLSIFTLPRNWRWWTATTLVAFTASLAISELFAATLLLLPFFALTAGRQSQPHSVRQLIRRLSIVVVLLGMITGATYVVLYRGSEEMAFRGGLDLKPLAA